MAETLDWLHETLESKDEKLIGGLKPEDFIISGEYKVGDEISTGIYELIKIEK